MTSPDARRVAFARFVERAIDHARATKGLTIKKISEASGVGENTLYRWQRGDWVAAPDGDNVAAFCDVLNIPRSVATAILWPDKGAPQPQPEPLGDEPDIAAILRRLADPNTTEREKYLIRETVRGLANRKPPRDHERRRRAG